MSPFKIECHGVTLEIALVDLGLLHPHEETLQEDLAHLVTALQNDQILRNPVMVDKRSLVVLDGMHRLAAAKSIGCNRMLVCLVDYMDPRIVLSTWSRTVSKLANPEAFRMAAKQVKLFYAPCDLESGRNSLARGEAVACLVTRDNITLLSDDSKSLDKAYRMLQRFQEALIAQGASIRYETEQDAFQKLNESLVDAVIVPPSIDKKDVIELARQGIILPPKSTRHLVPARPLNVNVLIDLLRESSIETQEADKRLTEVLRSRRSASMSPGCFIDDRRYEEAVLLFE